MLSPQLLQILRSLNNEERESLNDFLYSPFFNKSKTVQKLWEALKAYAPAFEDPSITREKIFTSVFPEKDYNYGTMKNLLHTFNLLLEEFLEITFHKADKFQHDYNSLVYSIVKYYPELFQKKYSKIIKDFEKPSEGMDFHYLYKYQLIRLASSFLALESKRNKALFEQGDSLIYFFLIHLFQVHYNVSVFRSGDNYVIKDNLIEEILKMLDIKKLMEKIKTNSPHDHDVVNLYYHLYLCRIDPENNEYFHEYKSMLLNSQKYLHEFEFESLTTAHLTFLNDRSLRGKQGTQKEISEFYKLLLTLKLNIGTTQDKISASQFGVILKQFFEALDIEYAKKFYEEFKRKLIEKDKESMKNFYNAFTYYTEGNCNKALEFSAKIKIETYKIKLYIKELQLKCYFELNESEHFRYSLKAYRELVYRSESLTKLRKENTKNFLNVINSLFEFKVSQKNKIQKSNLPKNNLNDIKFEIMNNKMICKEWILTKLKDIENKKNKN